QKFVGNLYGEGLGVRLRIVKGYFIVEVSEIAAPEALQRAQRLAVRMAHCIERCLIVEAARLDNQGVALPVRDRVTVERWQVELFRKLAAVAIGLPVEIAGFVYNHRQLRGLNDLDRFGQQVGERKSKTETGRGSICQQRPCRVSAHPYDGVGTTWHIFGSEVEQNVAAISVLRADLHSRRVDLDRLIYDAAI